QASGGSGSGAQGASRFLIPLGGEALFSRLRLSGLRRDEGAADPVLRGVFPRVWKRRGRLRPAGEEEVERGNRIGDVQPAIVICIGRVEAPGALTGPEEVAESRPRVADIELAVPVRVRAHKKSRAGGGFG